MPDTPKFGCSLGLSVPAQASRMLSSQATRIIASHTDIGKAVALAMSLRGLTGQ